MPYNTVKEVSELQKTFAERMKKAMQDRGIKQVELVERTKIGKSAISQYLSGLYIPKQTNTYLIAKALDVNEAWLMGHDAPMDKTYNNLKAPEITEDVVVFPVIGEIAAGYDSIAIEDWSGDTVSVPKDCLHGRKRDDFFVLSVVGESMYPMFVEGDKVLVLRQSTMNHSGEVGAVMYDNEHATLKRVEYKKGEDWMKLIAINPNYPPQMIEGADLESCKVMGIPWLLIRDLQSLFRVI